MLDRMLVNYNQAIRDAAASSERKIVVWEDILEHVQPGKDGIHYDDDHLDWCVRVSTGDKIFSGTL